MIDITERSALKVAAKNFANELQPAQLIGLKGALGAGKTTFVKEVAKALGVDADVISPTFVYHQTYELPEPVRGILRLHHLDLYRLRGDEDLDALGIELDDQGGVYLAEWLENVPKLARRASGQLRFLLNSDGTRSLEQL